VSGGVTGEVQRVLCRLVLCRLEEIADGQAKGFDLGHDAIFVVRAGRRIFAYRNACPHTGGMLDWDDEGFMSDSGEHILCQTHGALFQVDTGACLAGPCLGDCLAKVAVVLDGRDQVVLTHVKDAEVPAA
jgi:nitrite reductase/ring-hydroxylating ferredoxin subunit